MFSNSVQIMLSALFHTLIYNLLNEEAEAKSSTTLSEPRGPHAALGQLAGWLLLDHTADISTGAG